jgi:hypothetical protein
VTLFTSSSCGSGIAYIKEPSEGHFEVGVIAILTIGVETPCDPVGRCTTRMDIDAVNHYRIDYFDSSQEIQLNQRTQGFKGIPLAAATQSIS